MKLRNLAGLLACGVWGCNLANAGLETAVQEDMQAGHALIIVDMQPSFLFMVPRQELSEEVPYQIEVIRAAQRRHLPVFVLEYEEAESTIPELMEVVDDAQHEVITKPFGDGFRGTSLDTLLKEHDVHSVILAGVYASACVRMTAEGALEHGYSIVTSPEIIEDWMGPMEQATDEWYRHNGTWFESHDELVDYIEGL